MTYNPQKFAEKYKLALETTEKQTPSGGLNGYELEWNLLDEQFRPLLTVGAGPAQQSFVDHLRAECLPSELAKFSQSQSLKLIEKIDESLRLIMNTNANIKLVLENLFINF